MEYAPLPTEEQLHALAAEFGSAAKICLVRRIEGGLGCTMDLLELTEADGRSEKIMLRRYGEWYSDSPNNNVAAREFAALRTASAGGVKVPEHLWQDETGIFKEQAVIISYIHGHSELQPSDTISWADQIAESMAKVHAVKVDAATRNLLVDLRQSNTRYLAETEPPERFTKHPLGVRLWERRQELIEADLARPNPESTFLHGDLWPGNTLWQDGKLVAVVDWEEASFGDPAADVAYCASDMHYAGLPGAARRLESRYKELTGRTLEAMPLWTIKALCRPLPDIGRWFPSWPAMGVTNITIEGLRDRYRRSIEQALATQTD